MTLADALYNMVLQMMQNGIWVSPRFTDYRFQELSNTPDIDQIQREFELAIEEHLENVGGATAASPKAKEEPSLTASNILGYASSGTSGPPNIQALLDKFMPFLGPAMIASGVAMFLFTWAKSPGGPLDTRYKRDLRNEILSFYSRQIQRDTEIGERQVIIQASANFRNLGGTGNSNTLRQIRESGDRLAQPGLLVTDHATGLERLEP